MNIFRCVLLLSCVLLTNITAAQEWPAGHGPERQMEKLGLQFLPVSKPVGIYRRAVVTGNLVYVAGHIPIDDQGNVITGKVGDDVDLDAARIAAQRSGLAILSTLKHELGSLDRVKRLVKTVGMVNCTADFTEQPSVINGCSRLFAGVFGEEFGIGARSAVGMNSLPKGAVVEIEAVFELYPQVKGASGGRRQ